MASRMGDYNLTPECTEVTGIRGEELVVLDFRRRGAPRREAAFTLRQTSLLTWLTRRTRCG